METQETQKDPTCKERINDHFKSRFEDIKSMYDAYCRGEEDTEEGNICEYGLCFDYVPKGTFRDQKKSYFRYQISWGGPSDEFRFYVDESYKPYKIEYWFLDWFDGACKNLTGKKFEYMADFFTEFLGCGGKESLDYVIKQAL